MNELAHLFGRPSKNTRRLLKSFRQMYVSISESSAGAEAVTQPPPPLGAPLDYILPLDDFMETNGKERTTLLWPNLLFLRLTNCGLSNLDSSLYLLPVVKQIDISHNSISNFKYLRGCLNLRIANLSRNLFSSLRGAGSALLNIQRLNLSHNRLQSLRGLERLSFLERVDLSHNLISRADEVKHVLRLKKLEDLVLAGNPLATLYSESSDVAHRHPNWKALASQHQQVLAHLSQRSQVSRKHGVTHSRLQSYSDSLYRLMVFAYFYPEISPSGHCRTRDMVILDGEAMSDIENEAIM